jgi:hypothetical protein
MAKFINTISTWFWDDVDVQLVSTNAQTSAVLRHGGTVRCVLTVTEAVHSHRVE